MQHFAHDRNACHQDKQMTDRSQEKAQGLPGEGCLIWEKKK